MTRKVKQSEISTSAAFYSSDIYIYIYIRSCTYLVCFLIKKTCNPLFDGSLGPAAGEVKIIVLAKENHRNLVELERLPAEATVLSRGATAEDFSTPEGKQALAEANVFLVCPGEGSFFFAWEGPSGRV